MIFSNTIHAYGEDEELQTYGSVKIVKYNRNHEPTNTIPQLKTSYREHQFPQDYK